MRPIFENLAMDQIQKIARKMATSNVLRTMASPERSEQLLTSIRALSDNALDAMAALDGIPEEQYPIFRAHIRGEPNPFLEEVGAVDGKLRTGDVILMTGTAQRSKLLAAAQKPFYVYGKSSHVALVHADFICIDAIPGAGVSNRLIQDVLADVEDDWRVIRFKGIDERHADVIRRACSYYLAQPYKIKPSWKSGRDHAYCSELVRKVYRDIGLTGTGINASPIVAPAHFDQLADLHTQWRDVTADAKIYVDVCRKYSAMLKVTAKIFIHGLELNRLRFTDRKNALKQAQLAMSKKLLTKEKYIAMVKETKEIEASLHHHFWDTGKPLNRAAEQPT
ncbi:MULTISPECIES: YiiX/YebB-like N1pC/P60 family cysteine hydrolase [Ralstonia]|jgi:hypothetical protein|uniref:YiiX/YebB-like N1pC/P60 family cysteine hydrolase n=2 Tax=Burkholderiaceae TaxID=119060 RepID=UPI000CEE107D|nr:hypothetical protein F7R11_00575 [Ralstonia insidiosa]